MYYPSKSNCHNCNDIWKYRNMSKNNYIDLDKISRSASLSEQNMYQINVQEPPIYDKYMRKIRRSYNSPFNCPCSNRGSQIDTTRRSKSSFGSILKQCLSTAKIKLSKEQTQSQEVNCREEMSKMLYNNKCDDVTKMNMHERSFPTHKSKQPYKYEPNIGHHTQKNIYSSCTTLETAVRITANFKKSSIKNKISESPFRTEFELKTSKNNVHNINKCLGKKLKNRVENRHFDEFHQDCEIAKSKINKNSWVLNKQGNIDKPTIYKSFSGLNRTCHGSAMLDEVYGSIPIKSDTSHKTLPANTYLMETYEKRKKKGFSKISRDIQIKPIIQSQQPTVKYQSIKSKNIDSYKQKVGHEMLDLMRDKPGLHENCINYAEYSKVSKYLDAHQNTHHFFKAAKSRNKELSCDKNKPILRICRHNNEIKNYQHLDSTNENTRGCTRNKRSPNRSNDYKIKDHTHLPLSGRKNSNIRHEDSNKDGKSDIKKHENSNKDRKTDFKKNAKVKDDRSEISTTYYASESSTYDSIKSSIKNKLRKFKSNTINDKPSSFKTLTPSKHATKRGYSYNLIIDYFKKKSSSLKNKYINTENNRKSRQSVQEISHLQLNMNKFENKSQQRNPEKQWKKSVFRKISLNNRSAKGVSTESNNVNFATHSPIAVCKSMVNPKKNLNECKQTNIGYLPNRQPVEIGSNLGFDNVPFKDQNFLSISKRRVLPEPQRKFPFLNSSRSVLTADLEKLYDSKKKKTATNLESKDLKKNYNRITILSPWRGHETKKLNDSINYIILNLDFKDTNKGKNNNFLQPKILKSCKKSTKKTYQTKDKELSKEILDFMQKQMDDIPPEKRRTLSVVGKGTPGIMKLILNEKNQLFPRPCKRKEKQKTKQIKAACIGVGKTKCMLPKNVEESNFKSMLKDQLGQHIDKNLHTLSKSMNESELKNYPKEQMKSFLKKQMDENKVHEIQEDRLPTYVDKYDIKDMPKNNLEIFANKNILPKANTESDLNNISSKQPKVLLKKKITETQVQQRAFTNEGIPMGIDETNLKSMTKLTKDQRMTLVKKKCVPKGKSEPNLEINSKGQLVNLSKNLISGSSQTDEFDAVNDVKLQQARDFSKIIKTKYKASLNKIRLKAMKLNVPGNPNKLAVPKPPTQRSPIFDKSKNLKLRSKDHCDDRLKNKGLTIQDKINLIQKKEQKQARTREKIDKEKFVVADMSFNNPFYLDKYVAEQSINHAMKIKNQNFGRTTKTSHKSKEKEMNSKKQHLQDQVERFKEQRESLTCKDKPLKLEVGSNSSLNYISRGLHNGQSNTIGVSTDEFYNLIAVNTNIEQNKKPHKSFIKRYFKILSPSVLSNIEVKNKNISERKSSDGSKKLYDYLITKIVRNSSSVIKHSVLSNDNNKTYLEPKSKVPMRSTTMFHTTGIKLEEGNIDSKTNKSSHSVDEGYKGSIEKGLKNSYLRSNGSRGVELKIEQEPNEFLMNSECGRRMSDKIFKEVRPSNKHDNNLFDSDKKYYKFSSKIDDSVFIKNANKKERKENYGLSKYLESGQDIPKNYNVYFNKTIHPENNITIHNAQRVNNVITNKQKKIKLQKYTLKQIQYAQMLKTGKDKSKPICGKKNPFELIEQCGCTILGKRSIREIKLEAKRNHLANKPYPRECTAWSCREKWNLEECVRKLRLCEDEICKKNIEKIKIPSEHTYRLCTSGMQRHPVCIGKDTLGLHECDPGFYVDGECCSFKCKKCTILGSLSNKRSEGAHPDAQKVPSLAGARKRCNYTCEFEQEKENQKKSKKPKAAILQQKDDLSLLSICEKDAKDIKKTLIGDNYLKKCKICTLRKKICTYTPLKSQVTCNEGVFISNKKNANEEKKRNVVCTFVDPNKQVYFPLIQDSKNKADLDTYVQYSKLCESLLKPPSNNQNVQQIMYVNDFSRTPFQKYNVSNLTKVTKKKYEKFNKEKLKSHKNKEEKKEYQKGTCEEMTKPGAKLFIGNVNIPTESITGISTEKKCSCLCVQCRIPSTQPCVAKIAIESKFERIQNKIKNEKLEKERKEKEIQMKLFEKAGIIPIKEEKATEKKKIPSHCTFCKPFPPLPAPKPRDIAPSNVIKVTSSDRILSIEPGPTCKCAPICYTCKKGFWTKPCTCGSQICKAYIMRYADVLQEKNIQKQKKFCLCGSKICEKEIRKIQGREAKRFKKEDKRIMHEIKNLEKEQQQWDQERYEKLKSDMKSEELSLKEKQNQAKAAKVQTKHKGLSKADRNAAELKKARQRSQKQHDDEDDSSKHNKYEDDGTQSALKDKQRKMANKLKLEQKLEKQREREAYEKAKLKSMQKKQRLKKLQKAPIEITESRDFTAICHFFKGDITFADMRKRISGIKENKLERKERLYKINLRKKRKKLQHDRRLKRWKKDDNIRKQKRVKDEKYQAKKMRQYEGATDCMLISEALLDLLKLGFNITVGFIRCLLRSIINIPGTLKTIKDLIIEPSRIPVLLASAFRNSGIIATFKRIKTRFWSLKRVKAVITFLEQFAVTRFLLNLFHRDPRKRVRRVGRNRERLDYNCSLYMGSLKNKPCLCCYDNWPSFYPHCISLINLYHSFVNVMFFLAAVFVWSPCVIGMEICRACLCCLICSG